MQDYILLIGCTQSFFQSLTWSLSEDEVKVHTHSWPLRESDDLFLRDLSPFCIIVDVNQWEKGSEEDKRIFHHYFGKESNVKIYFVGHAPISTELPYDLLLVPLPVLELREMILKCR